MAIGMFYLSKILYDFKQKDKKIEIIDYIFIILCSLITFLTGLFLFFISTNGCNNYVKYLYLLFLFGSSIGSGIFESYSNSDNSVQGYKKYTIYGIYISTIIFGLFLIPRSWKCYMGNTSTI